MTREEFDEILEQTNAVICNREWYERVIKALEQEPCDDCISRKAVLNTLDSMDKALTEDRTVEEYKELLEECYKVLPGIQPKSIEGDAISKAEALNIINIEGKWIFNNDKVYSPVNVGIALTSIKKKIKNLPSVQPKPKTGHWIATENEEMEIDGYYCSECDCPMETEEKTRFCPNCGAEMLPTDSEKE